MTSSNPENDEYFIKAVREGYRARSAYKLLQLARCFDLFDGVKRVVDLCAAPGSWSQVISNKLHGLSNFRVEESIALCPGMTIVAVDLEPMPSVPGVIPLQADITKLSTCEEIMRIFKDEKVDLIVCDGAHDVSGMEIVDFQLHLGLITACIHIFLQILKEGGSFVTKMFDTWGCQIFIKQLRLFFREVHAVKPDSSRNESDECFAVCLGFKMPPGFNPSELTPYLDYSNRDFSKLIGIHKLYIPFLVTGMDDIKEIKLGTTKEDAEGKRDSSPSMVNSFDVVEKVYKEKTEHLRKIYKLCNQSKTIYSEIARMIPDPDKPLIVRLDKNDMVDFFENIEESNKEVLRQQIWQEFVEKMEKDGRLLWSKEKQETDADKKCKTLVEKPKKLPVQRADNPWILSEDKDNRPKCCYCKEVPKRNNSWMKRNESHLPEKPTVQVLSDDERRDEENSFPYVDLSLKTRLNDLYDEKLSLFTDSTQVTETKIDYNNKFLVLEDPNYATVELVQRRKQAFDELCQVMKQINCDAK